MVDVIDELGKHVPMEPRRAWKVNLVPVQEEDQVPGELFSTMVDAALMKRIAALEAEVAREHEAACALALAVGDIGEILGVQVTIAECAETKQAARRIVAEVARLRAVLAALLLVTHDSYSPTCGCDICRAVEVGRAALEPSP